MNVAKKKKCPKCLGMGRCSDGSICPTCAGVGEIDYRDLPLFPEEPCWNPT